MAGLGCAHYIEQLVFLGMRAPELSLRQREMRITRFAVNLGRVIGTAIGCLLGMFPLLFLDAGGRRGEDVAEGGKGGAAKIFEEEAKGGRGGGGSIGKLTMAEGTTLLAEGTEEGEQNLAVAKVSLSIAKGAERGEGGGGGAAGLIAGEGDGQEGGDLEC